MGLLSKIKSRQHVEETEATLGAPTGLLQKSLRVHSIQAAPEQPHEPPASAEEVHEWSLDTIQKIVQEINAMEQGIESPAYLFRLLQRWIGFPKGAFIMVDNAKKGWLTCAAAGWDDETVAKLKNLPPHALSFESISTSCRAVGRETIKGLQECFSNNDFADLDELTLKLLFQGTNPVALLVMCDIDAHGIDLIDRALQSEVLKLIDRRFEAIEKLGRPLMGDNNNLQEVLKLSDEQKEGPSAILKISFDGAIIAVKTENSYINPEWVRQDLFLVLGYLYTNLGKVFKSEENHIYLLLNNPDETDGSLLAHQSAHSLKAYFREIENPLYLYPEILSSRELLNSLIA